MSEINVLSRTQRLNVDMVGRVEVFSRTQKIIVDPDTRNITIIYAGPPGPTGEKGEPGAAGIDGGTAPFHFEQTDPASEWQIDHNRGTTEYAITLRDSDGGLFVASHTPINENRVVVSLPLPLTGTADLVF